MNLKFICLSLSCCLVLVIGQGISGQDVTVLSHPGVQVSQPLSREVVDYADFTGRTEAAESVEVLPRVSGRIDKVAFGPGAAVKQGDLLFEIDPRPYQADLDKTEAEAGRAEARAKRLAAALEQAKTLLAAHAITQEAFDRIAADREDVEAAVQASRAERDLARLNLEWTKVTAPISGRVGRSLLARGSLVTADTTRLVTVSGEHLYVSVGVDERTFLRLRRAAHGSKVKEAGAPVGLGFADEDGYPRRGQIDSLEYQVDSETDTVWLRAIVPNADGLLVPGLSARVRFLASAPHKALLVADAAVRVEQGQTYLFVVTERNVVERRNVELGGEHGGLRAVKEGLSAEDWILVNGPKDVSAGMTVQPKRVAMPAPTKKPGVEWPSSSGNGQP